MSTSVAALPQAGRAKAGVDSTAKETASRARANEYAELKRRVREKGLLDKQPGYTMFKLISAVALLAVGVVVLVTVNNFWLQMLNATFLAFVFGQFGFILHDAGHRQMLASTRQNDIVCLIAGNLLVGVSRGWWIDKHNEHHSNPNQVDMDPDIDFPVVAFTEEQALSKKGLYRFIVKYQAFFLFPLLFFEAWNLHMHSVKYPFKKGAKYPVVESLLLAAHFTLLFAGSIWALGFWQGLVFILVQQGLSGVYVGSVFAPNHKGMLVLEKDSDLDFLRRQVLTARNVTAHPFIDMWYGGLNYQIEHHLFPSMPRNKLGEAQKIVKEFCREHGISYYETRVGQSFKEILQYMHHVSAPLRA